MFISTLSYSCFYFPVIGNKKLLTDVSLNHHLILLNAYTIYETLATILGYGKIYKHLLLNALPSLDYTRIFAHMREQRLN